jgi:L-2-hydroxyglutarate oxidase LhgO
MKLGPNAFYVDALDYDVNPLHAKEFYQSAREFLPFLEEKDLFPDMAGMRPKLSGKGEKARDFVIRHESAIGYPGWINLLGIESPGLTSSPAIALYVKNLLKAV